MHSFRSRVSILLLIVIALSIAPIIFLEEPISDPTEAFIAYGVLGATMSLVVVLLFALRYEIGETDLIIKIGPITYGRLKLNEIESIERSYNPLSAPASSLKRLYISSKGKDALVSPNNEDEFIRLLKSRNANIQVKISDKDDWWRCWNWDI